MLKPNPKRLPRTDHKEMESCRKPRDHLASEAISVLRESAGLFNNPALLLGPDSRSKVLESLTEIAFEANEAPLPIVSSLEAGDRYDAYLRPETGSNFEVWPLYGKPPKEGQPWEIFPLASWSDRDVRSYLGSPDLDTDKRLLRMCVVGEPKSGKSTLVRALVEHSEDSIGSQSGSTHHHMLLRGQRYFIIDPPGQNPQSHGFNAAASAAELAVLVVDAEQGITETARRQAFVLTLLGLPQLVIAVNRMDAVGYSRQVYDDIVSDLTALLSNLDLTTLHCLPLSSRERQNISEPSSRMPWYEGSSLLGHLQTVSPASSRNLTDLRLPVQWSRGPWIGGQLASGKLSLGDRVVWLPEGSEVEVSEIRLAGKSVEKAIAGDSVSLRLAEPAEIERGHLLTTEQGLPQRSSTLEAIMVWLGDEPQEDVKPYLLHHGPRMVDAHVSEVLELLNSKTVSWEGGSVLEKGFIGKVRLTASAPIFFDTHALNREMGTFAILDRDTRKVLGRGVIRGAAQELTDVTANAQRLVSDHVVIDPTLVEAAERRSKYGHKPAVLWFTGLSGSGKSAVAKQVEKRLFEHGCHTLFLDGDNVRTGLNGDLGFTEEARTESNRRVSELAALAYDQGQIVVCSFISGRAEDRAYLTTLINPAHHLEFYVNCPIEVCRERDPKNLYKKADAGELLSFSGISIPYDEPENPSLELHSDQATPEELADRVWEVLQREGLLHSR